MEVCGDQYLPICLDLSSERTRQALSKSGTIFVKKRTSYKNKVHSVSNQWKFQSCGVNFDVCLQLSGSSFSAVNYGIGKVKGTVSWCSFNGLSPPPPPPPPPLLTFSLALLNEICCDYFV